MKVSPINASSNVCTFEVELTWEQAKALHELTPALLTVLGLALRERNEEATRQPSC